MQNQKHTDKDKHLKKESINKPYPLPQLEEAYHPGEIRAICLCEGTMGKKALVTGCLECST